MHTYKECAVTTGFAYSLSVVDACNLLSYQVIVRYISYTCKNYQIVF
jgi:hypothetical protein